MRIREAFQNIYNAESIFPISRALLIEISWGISRLISFPGLFQDKFHWDL